MKALLASIKRNPVMVTSFLSALVLVVVNFGFLTTERANSIVGVITTFLILLGSGAVARSKVVPVTSVITYKAANGVIVYPGNVPE